MSALLLFRTVGALVLLSHLCIEASSETAGEIRPDRQVVYKNVGSRELHLHVFVPEGHQPSDLRPAIVFFFGGGWTGGAPGQFYPHCQYLASRGMVAMAADYRVESRDGTTPRECVMDGKSAVRWIRRNAAELGIDPDRVAAGGGSAGGHVAAATGTTAAFDEPGEDLETSCVPDALVLFNPVFDNGPGGFGHDRVEAYWRELSPLHNINRETPRTIVFLGTADALVPVSAAESYKQKMEELGQRCELHLYPDQPHGFFNFKNRDFFNRTVIEMDRFLASLGFLEGAPTLRVDDRSTEDSSAGPQN